MTPSVHCVVEYPTFTVRPGDSVVFEGSDVNIDCRARGKPTPVVGIVSASGDGFVAAIDGRIDIHPILGTTIKNASKRDTGLYYCNATSDAGTAITEFVITVLRMSIVCLLKLEFRNYNFV